LRILVTGGAGFIGSRVVQQLACRPGLEVALVLRETTALWRLQGCGVHLNDGTVRAARADLMDDGQVRALMGSYRPEVLIHLAMVYHPPGSAPAADVAALNYDSTVRLLDAFLAASGRRFISAGTCFEYGPHDRALLTEETECRPNYDYAEAKARAAAAVIRAGAAAGAETAVLRVFAPYGPMEGRERILPQLILTGLTSGHLDLTAGEQVRDYVHVEDVARAFVAAALGPRLPVRNAVYNVASGVGCSVRELAARVEAVLGKPLSLAWGARPYRANEMMRLVGDGTRLGRDLGWGPRYDLAAGIRQTAAWWAENAGVALRSAA
jgi:nucleoside-diphosphate-sugar epimerase